jgi:hypothetical protein
MHLKQAMRNPASFWDVLKMFEDRDFAEQVDSMMNDPTFQEQATTLNAKMWLSEKAPENTLASLLLAVNPVSTRPQRSASARMETLSELKDYAKKTQSSHWLLGSIEPCGR